MKVGICLGRSHSLVLAPMGNIHSARLNFLQVVIPAYEEMGRKLADGVTGDRRDVIALAHAAAACLHLSDYAAREAKPHHFVPGAPKSKDYIKELSRRSRDFAITRDVANAFKHKKVSDQDRTLDGIEALLERWALIRYYDEQGFYWGTRKIVLIRLNDGREILAEDLIWRCIKFWAGELARLELIPSEPNLGLATPKYSPRPKSESRPKISMMARAGEWFESQPIVLFYDSASDSFVPPTERICHVEVDVEMLVEPAVFDTGAADAKEHRFTLSVGDSASTVG